MKKLCLFMILLVFTGGAFAITCPTVGECSDTDYKTVNNGASCGSGYVEDNTASLEISGSFSDGKGTYGYATCTVD